MLRFHHHHLLLRPPSASFPSPIPFPAAGPSPEQFHRRRRRRRIIPKIVLASFGGDRGRWKLTDIDRAALQQTLGSWLLKARTALAEAALPLVNPGHSRKHAVEKEPEGTVSLDEIFMPSEVTVERRTPNGYLSLAAVFSIEQFGRMNGLTGRKIQYIFDRLAPEPIRSDARSLVEYCCFRYLSRDKSDLHPSLQDLAFQRLIFVTMLAWEQPYARDGSSQFTPNNASLQGRTVGEDAFIRIAPAVAGIADISTAHHLFKALVGDEKGLSFTLWTAYLAELLKVHQGRQSYQTGNILLPSEQILCIGSSRKRPVLKWEGNIAWPGNLTLTDRALYFEAIELTGTKRSMKLDLSQRGSRVEKARVGPFESKLFDSAVSVSTVSKSETWVLEFVDFGGEMRRDVWYASIYEIISLYDFIREYGPADDDPAIHDVYGAHRGRKRVISNAANGVARLQALQSIRRFSEDPSKLVQFSYLLNVPYGDIVLQTLAVSFWGGQFVAKFKKTNYGSVQRARSIEDFSSGSTHVFDIDGSVYLRKWMRSPTWFSSSSIAFWKSSISKRCIVLAKNLVVADLNLVERATSTCREKSRIIERTQATIDAAMIQGIPSNIDLFKELMLPFVLIAKEFHKLRCWEEPRLTISFLILAYTIIFRNMLSYVFPMTLMAIATAMLLLKGLKSQGRLGRSFGKVTIRDQPPSNTLQKIIALKEAMAYMENYLQNINVSLLKIRTIILSGQPEVTTEVALLLFGAAAVLLVVPFKYILAFILFDSFTRELEFRREMVIRFMSIIRERWGAIHAAPVVVIPFDSDESASIGTDANDVDQVKSKRTLRNESATKS